MLQQLKSFDDEFRISVVEILIHSYMEEKKSIEDRTIYENLIKDTYPDEYENFLEYKKEVENRTPNLKQIVFDWFDGKIDDLNFDYFSPEGLNLTFL